MRQQCGEVLLKGVKTASGKKIFSPLKVFCYKSVAGFVQQPGMLDIFNQWKNRQVPNGIMSDVYDGRVWKSFLSVNGEDLLADRYTLGLLINVDWFQPSHIQLVLYTFRFLTFHGRSEITIVVGTT